MREWVKQASVQEWVKQLDRILRGEATSLPALREQTIEVPAGGLSLVVTALGVVYGICMGFYAVFGSHGPRFEQMLASTVKVPALFFLTLVVTLPSLYVFNALVGSRLTVLAVLRLLIASLAVNLAVLASLGPIVAFFSVSATSYPFMVLLNVVVFALSGVLGLTFLLQTLHRMSIAPHEVGSEPLSLDETPEDPPERNDTEQTDARELVEGELIEAELVEDPGALDRIGDHMLGKHVKTVFACWIVVFGLVGAQMGWVLRPFIGDPGQDFEWFRARGSNFFEAVLRALHDLIF